MSKSALYEEKRSTQIVRRHLHFHFIIIRSVVIIFVPAGL